MRLSLFALLDRWLAPAPAPKKVDWLAGVTYAHRGLHGPQINGFVPENSPTAFAGAIARGLGIECDVQWTGDGQVVVFHDWDLDRLTGESGPVAQRTATQLGAIALTDGADTIPSLRQMLDQVGGKVPILIEVKSGRDSPISALSLAVRRELEGYRGPHAVMSFDPRVSRWFARHSPQTVRGLVMTEEHDRGLRGNFRRHLSLWHGMPDFLAYDIRDLPSRFAAVQRTRGFPVPSWTVKTPELLARAALHADAPIAEAEGIA
jgi:glycerophosphoryl diester phosphodiesterase